MATVVKLEEVDITEFDSTDEHEILQIFEQKPVPAQCSEIGKLTSEKRHVCSKTVSASKTAKTSLESEKKYRCQYCPKTFTGNSNRKTHQKLHTEVRPHKCNYCHHSFQKYMGLVRHQRQHLGDNPFSCIFCPKSFPENGRLFLHLLTHVGEKPHTCQICGRGFANPSALRKHVQCHTGSLPQRFVCKYCNKKFAANNHYQDHLRVHTNERPYKCDLCPDKAYKQNSALNHHKRTFHQGVLPFQCKVCKKGFGTSHQLFSHVNHVHRPENEENVKCEICSKEFKHLIRLRKHMFTIHKEGAKTFKCSKCEKVFATRSLLKIHTAAVHLGIRTRNKPCCNFRNVTLTTKGPMPVPEQVWNCKRCKNGKTFCCKISLERHLWRFHTPKRFQCLFCQRILGDRRVYEVHLRNYLEEKPVFCKECGHESSTPESGERHMINEHGQGRRYPCPLCEKSFDKPATAQVHLKKAHGTVKRIYQTS